jgi:hypothetical protein
MTLQDKFEAALAVLAEHNTAIGGVSKSGYVDPDQFISNLKALGATTEDRLKSLSYEDILEAFPPVEAFPPGSGAYVIKPKLIAKDIAKIFRGWNETPVFDSSPRPISSKKASQMTILELIQSFDPEDPTGPVGTRLSQIAKGHAFIVYESGRIIDVDSTCKLLQEIKQGFPGREDFVVNGKPVPVFKVGELPNNFADENPLYVGRPLRPDGTCDQTGRSWEGVELEVRQLIRIATQGSHVSFDDAHKFLDLALGDDPMKTIRNRYRTASLQFDNLAATGNLPTLKITLGSVEGSKGKGNNPRPFGDGKQVVWAQAPADPKGWPNLANYYVKK